MKQKLYIDGGEPLLSAWPETLTDGSEVWQLNFRGGEVLNCLNEARADEAFRLIALAVKIGTGEALVL